jgi:hypothetical protein
MATDQLILELRRYAGTNRPTDDVTILMMDVIDAIAAR